MRKDPHVIGSFVHVVKRGARGLHIVRDETDRWRFLKLIRYLNDANTPRNWEREISSTHIQQGFVRPDHWMVATPYVEIVGFCLMDNHFHLLLRPLVAKGIAKFMQRLCTSMSLYHNTKYRERGTIFQGPYHARTVENDRHLQYLAAYIQVKNPLERYPGGLRRAAKNFAHAFRWALEDPFSSLADFMNKRSSPLVTLSAVREIFMEPSGFEQYAEDVVWGRLERDDALDEILLD